MIVNFFIIVIFPISDDSVTSGSNVETVNIHEIQEDNQIDKEDHSIYDDDNPYSSKDISVPEEVRPMEISKFLLIFFITLY